MEDEYKHNGKAGMAVCALLILGIGAYYITDGFGEKRINGEDKVIETVKDTELDGEGKEVVNHSVSKEVITNIIATFEKSANKRLEAIGLLKQKIPEVYDATLVKFEKEQSLNSDNNGMKYYIDTRQWMFHSGILDLRPVLKVEGIKQYNTLISGTGRIKLNDAQIEMFNGTEYYNFLKGYSINKKTGNGPYENLMQINITNESAHMNNGTYDMFYGSIVAAEYYTYGEMVTIKKMAQEYGLDAFEEYTYNQLEDMYDEAKNEKLYYFDTFNEMNLVYKSYVNGYVTEYIAEYQKFLDTIGDFNYRFMNVQSDEELLEIVEDYKNSYIYRENWKELMDKYGKQGEYDKVINVKASPYSSVYQYEYEDDIKLYEEFKKAVCGITKYDIQLVTTGYLDQLKYVNRVEEEIAKQIKEQNSRLYNFKLYILNNGIENSFTFLDDQLYYERCPFGERKVGKEEASTVAPETVGQSEIGKTEDKNEMVTSSKPIKVESTGEEVVESESEVNETAEGTVESPEVVKEVKSENLEEDSVKSNAIEVTESKN